MRITVVIPCHHRVDLLGRALRAVAGLDVVVVDDSVDGRVRPDGVARVRTAGEQGFASAVNLGLEEAQLRGATHALVLNDDAAPAPGCVSLLAESWQADTGAAGPLIYGPEGLESAGFELSWWGRVRQRRSLGAAADAQGGAMREGVVHEVEALSGAALLIAANTRFDPAYRHGFEDLALCRELRRRGRKVLLVPAARVMHLGGATLGRATREAQRHAMSGHLRYLDGGWRAGVAVGLATAQVLREGGDPERLAGVRDGVRDWLGARRAGRQG